MKRKAFESLALGLPGTSLAIQWDDDLVASVGGKMYAVLCLSGSAAGALSFKVGQEAFLAWTGRTGVRPASYLARAYWVQLTPDSGVPPREVEAAVRASHALVASGLTRAARRALGIEAAPPPQRKR